MTQVRGTSCVGGCAGCGEELAAVDLGYFVDVLEDVAFGDDVGSVGDLEGVAAVVVPLCESQHDSINDQEKVQGREDHIGGSKCTYVVVDSMKKSVSLNLWRPSASVVDIITLHGNQII